MDGHPATFLSTWMQAINRLQRMFIISGACSPPIASTTGFPEGDALSVNAAFHAITNQAISPGWVFSYVDNWEMITHQVDQVDEALAQFRHFATLTHLTLDEKKTYTWSTTAIGRKALRARQFHVKLDGRDLGGHMQYSLRHTMYTLKARMQSCEHLWTWLRRSPAPVQQKLKVIQTVAWPRCLYGVSTVRVGKDHFAKLRAQAMSSLGWNKKGASSHLQFALVQQCKYDPEAAAAWDTIKSFRTHADPTIALPLLNQLVANPPVRLKPGPCATLLEWLHLLQWRWVGDGYVEDHWDCQWHLLDTPIQHLSSRFAQAWALRTGQQHHGRDTLQGLDLVDRAFTMSDQRRWTDQQSAMMRTSLNGTFYTRDKQIHSGKIASTLCAWCEQPDSLDHRIWHCPHFEDLRQAIPTEDQQAIQAMPHPPPRLVHGDPRGHQIFPGPS